MKKLNLKRVASVIYAVVIAAMAFLYFTNDFGLVDIRKTAVIIGAGIDLSDEGVSVTAQLAIPQSDSTQYIEVEGEGVTVADALNEINKKTGFYPKLVFCKLLILGESCSEGNIFEILDYFYRDDYTQLTPVVAMCKGSAGELLSSRMRFGNTATVSIERLLSDEAKKSGNVSTVNLKMIGIHDHSPSSACYMPFIRVQEQTAKSSQSQPESNSSGDSSGGTPEQGDSSGGGKQEFLCDRTAIFSSGRLSGVLDERQTFALNLIRNNVRHIFVPCMAEGKQYTLGMRNCKGNVSVAVRNGQSEAEISFSAVVQVSDVDSSETLRDVSEGVTSPEVLAGGADEIRAMFSSLVDALREAGCDALGFRTLLYRFCPADYEKLGENILSDARVNFKVDLRSAG